MTPTQRKERREAFLKEQGLVKEAKAHLFRLCRQEPDDWFTSYDAVPIIIDKLGWNPKDKKTWLKLGFSAGEEEFHRLADKHFLCSIKKQLQNFLETKDIQALENAKSSLSFTKPSEKHNVKFLSYEFVSAQIRQAEELIKQKTQDEEKIRTLIEESVIGIQDSLEQGLY